MESHGEEESDFTSVIENLVNMFGNAMTREVIATVVESCEGDLNLSIDAIMNITNDGNAMPNDDDNNSQQSSTNANTNTETPPQQSRPTTSYAAQAVKNRGAISKQVQPNNNIKIEKPIINFWTDQIRHIMTQHNKGARIMIVMRGLPGSGKSFLAKLLIESMIGSTPIDYKTHIYSTDDYFMFRGQYQYDKNRLSHAHCWNQKRVLQVTAQGLSPVIIDNTNVELWEMHPYLGFGVANGYIIELVEPNTPWAKKAGTLFRKNTHNVPLNTIKRMLDNFANVENSDSLLRSFGMSYPAHMIPPVMRLIPLVQIQEEASPTPESEASISTLLDSATSQDFHLPIQSTSYSNEIALVQKQEETSSIPESEAIFSNLLDSATSQDFDLSVQSTSYSDEIALAQIQEKTSSTPESEAIISTLLDSATTQDFDLPIQSTSYSDENGQEKSTCAFNNSAPENIEEQSTENQVEGKIEEQVESNVVDKTNELSQEEQTKRNYVQEALKRLEELEKFEDEWENGEKWEETDQIAVVGNPAAVIHTDATTNANAGATTLAENITSALVNKLESKPPRKDKKAEELHYESADNSLMQSVNNCQDWREISLFMPPWVQPHEQPITPTQKPPIETTTSGTCVEMYDTHITGKHKVITTTPRDINEYYIPPEREKIPDKRMLDKSTMTDEGIVMTYHCPQKERHFVAFRNLFKNIERESLRYIFDNCCGDANWAVENILGGGVKYKLKSNEDDDESELEEESDLGSGQHCNCMAQYGITPNASKLDSEPQTPQEELTPPTPENTATPLEKKKRDATISDENMQLKRQIEQNVVISDSHYSEHCLKIRKFRRGEYIKNDNSFDQPSTSGLTETASGPDVPIPSAPVVDNSDDDDDGGNFCDAERDKIVNMNVGKTFIRNLDEMFGRQDMEYPDSISFNISMPSALLNEINALWMESMMFQFDENAKRSAAMIKQDEEFARQLAKAEAELMLAGKEPNVPDFREIMDLEFSLSLSLKDSTEWRNHVPTDIAAKMTHEKLYNLFPEIDKDILLEMLVAHDNDFKSTVEVLLTSLGRADIVEEENGVNKYIMGKELERKDKIIQEEQAALASSELTTEEDVVDMATVQFYRDKAERHLNKRNMVMNRAEDYIRRGMTQVAHFYSELANLHRSRYEQANSKAVALLMQYHANNQDGETVDLHYLRVKEAKEAMDLFIDNHIQRLKHQNKRSVTLFFITGRGLHSPGLPRVKPACMKRLRERGLSYAECNPGLLRSRVTIDSKMTYQIP